MRGMRSLLVSRSAWARSSLMLAEGNFLAPIDYRDLLLQYRTAHEAAHWLSDWQANIEREFREGNRIKREHVAHEKLATELRGLQIGEYIAENEAVPLVADYFVEPSAFQEALNGSHVVFVGRKGSGKTANLLKLASELGKNKRGLVCVIKPAAYEFDGLLNLFKRFKERDSKGYAVESLWKFLILTEVANVAAEFLRSEPFGLMSPQEASLLNLITARAANLAGILQSGWNVVSMH